MLFCCVDVVFSLFSKNVSKCELVREPPSELRMRPEKLLINTLSREQKDPKAALPGQESPRAAITALPGGQRGPKLQSALTVWRIKRSTLPSTFT